MMKVSTLSLYLATTQLYEQRTRPRRTMNYALKIYVEQLYACDYINIECIH